MGFTFGSFHDEGSRSVMKNLPWLKMSFVSLQTGVAKSVIMCSGSFLRTSTYQWTQMTRKDHFRWEEFIRWNPGPTLRWTSSDEQQHDKRRNLVDKWEKKEHRYKKARGVITCRFRSFALCRLFMNTRVSLYQGVSSPDRSRFQQYPPDLCAD